jgi:hypothetical protein
MTNFLNLFGKRIKQQGCGHPGEVEDWRKLTSWLRKS